MFSEFHYMDKKINNANRFYIAWWRAHPVGCVAATGFPGAVRQGTAFREHRTVILPDFQGLGVGTRMSNAVASVMLRSGAAPSHVPLTRAFYARPRPTTCRAATDWRGACPQLACWHWPE